MNIDIKRVWNLNCPNRIDLWRDPSEQNAFKGLPCAPGRTKKVLKCHPLNKKSRNIKK